MSYAYLCQLKIFVGMFPRKVLQPYLSRYEVGYGEKKRNDVRKLGARRVKGPGPGHSGVSSASGAYAISIAFATVCSSRQSIFTATNTFRYHPSFSVPIASFTASVPLSARFITTSHISPTLSLQAHSFSSDTSSSCPSIVSRHRLEAAAISSFDHTVALAWKLC